MHDAVTYFDPQPTDVPERLADPFAPLEPHPLARRAAEALERLLREGRLPAEALEDAGRGKMFGVLVVRAPDGRVGYLQGFSGMLAGRWLVPGFVPPLFDVAARDAFWPAGEAQLDAFAARHHALSRGADVTALRAELAALDARHAEEASALQARHDASRAARQGVREAGASDDVLQALARESHAQSVERRHLEARQREERARVQQRLEALESQRREVERARAEHSNALLARIWDGYVLTNARDERRPLRALFPTGIPTGGAGDCAGPKLVSEALRRGLTPLALAEFWWGAPSADSAYRAGQYYPACRSKCARVLPFLLEGLGVEVTARDPDEVPPEAPHVVHEDTALLVVDKPAGLLSSPGRHNPQRDSVLVRLARRYPDSPGLQLVNELDAETSGLLLVARDDDTARALRKQAALGQLETRYVAWLDGEVAVDAGRIELPLRSEPPRQVVDSLGGKDAVTEWRVLAREPGRTRVHLVPRTGRPHQLRVHVAAGLGAPVVGDALYGRGAERLLLHAEALCFTHPRTSERVTLRSAAPF